MFWLPFKSPKGDKAMSQIHTFIKNHSGKNKFGDFCDEYHLRGKWVEYAKNYANYLSQHMINILLATETENKYYIMAAN